MVAAFEHFVYAWSARGLEGASRFQVTAATPRIRAAFIGRAPLLDHATRLAYWEAAPSDPASRVFGWRWTELGLFCFVKRRVGPEHWAAPGGFVLHGFHTVDRPSLGELCSLLDPQLLDRAEQRAVEGDVLEPVNPSRDLPDAPEPPNELAEQLVAWLLSAECANAALAVTVASEDFIAALVTCAHRAPLPTFTRRSVSTSEAPQRVAGVSIVGVGPSGSPTSYPNLRFIDAATLEQLHVARVALANPSASHGAIDVSTGADGFDTGLFAATTLVLSGDTGRLDEQHAAIILRRPEAAQLALAQPTVRARLVDLSCSRWAALGASLVHAASISTDGEQVVDALTAKFLDTGFPRSAGGGTPFSSWLRPRVAARVAAVASGAERSLISAPVSVLADVSASIGQSAPTHRRSLRESLLDRLAERLEQDFTAVGISERDRKDLARRWFRRRSWPQFGAVVRSLSSEALAELVDLVEGDEGCRALDEWLTTTATGPDGETSRRLLEAWMRRTGIDARFVRLAGRLRGRVPAETAVRLIADRLDAVSLSTLEPAAHAALGSIAATLVTDCLQVRTAYPIFTPTARESDLLRVLRRSSVECMLLSRAAELRAVSTARRNGTAVDEFHRWLNRLATTDAGITETAVAILLSKIVMVAEPQELASIVEAASQVTHVEPLRTWETVFAIVDAIVQVASSGDDRRQWIDLFTSAVAHGVRLSQFGRLQAASSLVGAGQPREIRALAERWRR